MTANTNHHAEHSGQTRDALFLLIRIYTPFICALMMIIYSVMYLCEYTGKAYFIINELCGHSVLLIMYIVATSKRMCVWYKTAVYLLLATHVLNFLLIFEIAAYVKCLSFSLGLSTLALLSFMIYRLSVGITKVLCP